MGPDPSSGDQGPQAGSPGFCTLIHSSRAGSDDSWPIRPLGSSTCCAIPATLLMGAQVGYDFIRTCGPEEGWKDGQPPCPVTWKNGGCC